MSISVPTACPIFIVGVHRSATTLLRYMLSSSPRIYIPPESDFIPRFFGRHPLEPLSRSQAVQIFSTIFSSYRFVREWKGERLDPEAFVDRLPDLMLATVLNTLYRCYVKQYGAVRWGDKTPIYTTYIDLIVKIFPSAQFIHILRDGGDVALSMMDKWGRKEFHIDFYYAAREWKRRIRRARASGMHLGPDHYYEICYKDLVKNSRQELKAVCSFLDEYYVPEMSKPHRLARNRVPEHGFSAPVRQPPNTSRVARWRREMSVADQRLFQHIAGDLLEELGYEVVDVGRMSMREIVRVVALGIKYESLQAGRRLLQRLGVLPPN